jgi:hypothetical protein
MVSVKPRVQIQSLRLGQTYMDDGWPSLGLDIIGTHRMVADATSVESLQ